MAGTVRIPIAGSSDVQPPSSRRGGDGGARASDSVRPSAFDVDSVRGASLAPPSQRPKGAGGRPKCPTCGERFSRGARFCPFDGVTLVEGPEDTAADPLVGQVIDGRYAIVRVLGEGGMGTVYEARHETLDRRFALKVLRREIAKSPEHVTRFIQEAKAAAAIGHAGIASVTDFGECEVAGRSVRYFVMEYLSGSSLAAVLLANRTLPPARAARIIRQAAEALAAAHAAGVVHRDLKPDNIFLTGQEKETVKILDFGIAKIAGAGRITKHGMAVGTPHYMSPEQARGQVVDHRTDIYSLGIMLYECLCGRVPFESDTSMGVLTKQIFAVPEDVERVCGDQPGLGGLGAIVRRCLAKEPVERFANMMELAEALEQAVQDPVGASKREVPRARASGRTMRLRDEASVPGPMLAELPMERRRPWAIVAGAVGVAAIAALFVWSLRDRSPQTPSPAASVVPSTTAVAALEPTTAEPAPSTTDTPTTATPTASTSASASGSASAPGKAASTSGTSPSGIIRDPWNTKTRTKPPPQPTGPIQDPWKMPR